ARELLQPLDEVQLREVPDERVGARLPVGADRAVWEGSNAGGVRGHEVERRLLAPSDRIHATDLGCQPPATPAKERVTVQRDLVVNRPVRVARPATCGRRPMRCYSKSSSTGKRQPGTAGSASAMSPRR